MTTAPNFRSRGFSVVVHNVFDEPVYWTSVVKSMKYDTTVISIEPYAHQDGFHLHIFTDHKNPCRSNAFFKVLTQAKHGHIQEGDDKGRIQIDSRHGTFQEATAYLTQADTKKDKVCGTPVVHNKNHIKCTSCQQSFPLGLMYTNSPQKTGICKFCFAHTGLIKVMSRQYVSYTALKFALDDFQDTLERYGFPKIDLENKISG